jgi:predicted Zn-dependent peptidase
MQHTVSKVSLPNGIEGIFIDIPSANVTSIDIVFRAGDYLSPEGKTDTAHVMEHLVLGANKKYPSSKEFSKEFTKYGAYNNAYTGDYHMGYEAECEAGETERIIDLLCVAIESPLFTQTDFKAEIGNVREELKMRRNNDDVELSLLLENAMGFIPKSYRAREKELSSIELSDVESHYKRTHTTSNLRFVIAGPVSKSTSYITERLATISLPKGTGHIPLPDEIPHDIPDVMLVKNENLDNLCYRWEAVLPKFISYVERDSLNAVHEILFNGFHSRVFGDLREKGLVYGIFGSYYETKENTVHVITGQVQAANIQEVFTILKRELIKVAEEGVSEEELDELKKRAFGEVQRYNQTPGQLNNWYRHGFVTRGEIMDFNEFADRLEKLSNESIKAAATQILETDVHGIGIMHNVADKPDPATLRNILIG